MSGRRVVATLAIVVALLGWFRPAPAVLATLTPSRDAVRPGQQLTVTGTSFAVSRDPAVESTQVVLRWRTIDGPVLAETEPGPRGTFAVTVTVPESPAGHTLIVATQRRPVAIDPAAPDGPTRLIDEPGTPARTTVRVLAPGEPAPVNTPRRTTPTSADPGTSPTLLVLIALSGGVALSLFGGAVIAVFHHARIRSEPEPWRPPGW